MQRVLRWGWVHERDRAESPASGPARGDRVRLGSRTGPPPLVAPRPDGRLGRGLSAALQPRGRHFGCCLGCADQRQAIQLREGFLAISTATWNRRGPTTARRLGRPSVPGDSKQPLGVHASAKSRHPRLTRNRYWLSLAA